LAAEARMRYRRRGNCSLGLHMNLRGGNDWRSVACVTEG
jgi:hypothetical protein